MQAKSKASKAVSGMWWRRKVCLKYVNETQTCLLDASHASFASRPSVAICTRNFPPCAATRAVVGACATRAARLSLAAHHLRLHCRLLSFARPPSAYTRPAISANKGGALQLARRQWRTASLMEWMAPSLDLASGRARSIAWIGPF